MSVRIQKNSRLQFADLLTADGIEFWDTLDMPTIVAQTDDLVHTVQSKQRIDQIAALYYGDPVLWWVIAVANDLEILPTALDDGRDLKIPAPRYVLQELLPSARTK